MKTYLSCPQCGTSVLTYRNPTPTTDVIIYDEKKGIVLIERANPPLGYALPGGFVDLGESVEQAAVREMREETSLDVVLCGLLGVYSAPERDPRFHTMSVVFVGKAQNTNALCAGDDAKNAAFFSLDTLPPLAFDHMRIVQDFIAFLQGKRVLAGISM